MTETEFFKNKAEIYRNKDNLIKIKIITKDNCTYFVTYINCILRNQNNEIITSQYITLDHRL